MLGGAGSEFSNTLEEWFRRIHPEDSEFFRREIKSLLVQDTVQFETQHRMIHKDGCYRWMLCRGVITRDSTGRAIRISGCHIDITAEKVVDELTGLPNRLLLQDRLTRSIEKARKRDDFLFAVLIIDLDLFQSGINRLETVNADPLLIAAARRLELSLRAEDNSVREDRAHLVARSGGEEFIVLLDGLCSLDEAKNIADQLLREMLAPFDFNGQQVFLSPSIGIALSATDYANADEALRDADTALYRARSFGKSCCEIFDTAVLESTRTWNRLEQDLQDALSRNEFQVFYQPIVSLSTNRISGFEALVRWNHPARGLVFPKDFLPAAEKTGLIVPLDRWVLQEACRQLKSWQELGISKDLWISINISGMQLKQSSLLNELRETLLETRLDASSLVLELTEGTIMENPETARSLLMQLRVLGTRIALDDFGTGYSSLAHLRRFPLDYLKIDHSFVRNIRSADTMEIVRAITTMARQLGLRVVAEGIENSNQLNLLRSLDCEYGQGFLCSKAVDGRQAERLLLNEVGFPAEVIDIERKTAKPERRALNRKRNYVLLALPVLILLVMAGLFARLNRFTPPPVAHTPPQISPTETAKPAMADPWITMAEIPPAQKQQEIPATRRSSKPTIRPKTVQSGPPEQMGFSPISNSKDADLGKAPIEVIGTKAAATYPVVHDHKLGNCRGNLTITVSGVSFASEKGKDSFDLKFSELSYALDRDQLVLRSGSRVFRFKSANAFTKDQNKAHLVEIYGTISKSEQK
jgi:diguanylate cyclase (GGDEF)-like protein